MLASRLLSVLLGTGLCSSVLGIQIEHALKHETHTLEKRLSKGRDYDLGKYIRSDGTTWEEESSSSNEFQLEIDISIGKTTTSQKSQSEIIIEFINKLNMKEGLRQAKLEFDPTKQSVVLVLKDVRTLEQLVQGLTKEGHFSRGSDTKLKLNELITEKKPLQPVEDVMVSMEKSKRMSAIDRFKRAAGIN